MLNYDNIMPPFNCEFLQKIQKKTILFRLSQCMFAICVTDSSSSEKRKQEISNNAHNGE